MNNIKNLMKILLALGLLGAMMFIAAFAFTVMLGVAAIVAVTLYVKSILPHKTGATIYYEPSEVEGKVIEGEIITSEKP